MLGLQFMCRPKRISLEQLQSLGTDDVAFAEAVDMLGAHPKSLAQKDFKGGETLLHKISKSGDTAMLLAAVEAAKISWEQLKRCTSRKSREGKSREGQGSPFTKSWMYAQSVPSARVSRASESGSRAISMPVTLGRFSAQPHKSGQLVSDHLSSAMCYSEQLCNLSEPESSEVRSSETSMEMIAVLDAFLNAATSSGQTPLMYACQAGQAECVSLLLDLGADAWIADARGSLNALHHACKEGHASCIEVLLAKAPPADLENGDIRYVESSTYAGFTAIHWAALSGSSEAVRVLLEHASPNIFASNSHIFLPGQMNRYPTRSTALHVAAGEGHKQAIIEILHHYMLEKLRKNPSAQLELDQGDPRVKRDSKGRLPLMVYLDMQSTAEEAQQSAIKMILNPQTSLWTVFGTGADCPGQSRRGPLKLSVIAGHTLKAHLLHQLQSMEGKDNPVPGPANNRAASDHKEECALCLTNAPNTRLSNKRQRGCNHTMCHTCALGLCAQSKGAEVAVCPFCRAPILGFQASLCT